MAFDNPPENVPSKGTPLSPGSEPNVAFTPFSFAVIADLHLTKADYNGRRNLEWFINWLQDRPDIEFVLALGDLACGMPFPTWEQARAMLTDAFARMGRPVHVVYGNNDPKLIEIETYGVWERIRAYEDVWGKRDRTFEHRGCLFVVMWNALTPVRKHGHQGYLSDAQWAWLEAQLIAARQCAFHHIFLAAHVPPACPDWPQPGLYMRKATERRFWNVCAAHNITAAFFGHVHLDRGRVLRRGNTQVIVAPSLNNLNFLPPPPHDLNRRSGAGYFNVITVHERRLTHELITIADPPP